jgi:tRNA/tmRNA/rRNA uracil-C5-methylase (TrmA/RlmC/RlmD family)
MFVEKKQEEIEEETVKIPKKLTSLYRITDIAPVDMFPHTHHIETVVRLEKI